MYRSVIRPILFALHIERAHRTVVWLLRLAGWLPGGLWLLSRCFAVRHPALGREVFGLHFDNPVGLGASTAAAKPSLGGVPPDSDSSKWEPSRRAPSRVTRVPASTGCPRTTR